MSKMDELTVIIPHTPLHDVRTTLYKTFGSKVEDILVIYDKAILDSDDYDRLKVEAREKLSKLNGKKVALLLTGSYAACILVYEVLRENNCKVTLLQYDAHLKRYQVVEA